MELKVLLSRGLNRNTACGAVRITPKTMRNWMDRGEKGEEPFASFALDIAEAESAYEQELQDAIKVHAPADYKAAAFLIERRFPKHWGAKQQVEHSGSIGSAPTSQEQAAAARRLMDSEFGRVAPPDEGPDVETRPTEPSGDEDSSES